MSILVRGENKKYIVFKILSFRKWFCECKGLSRAHQKHPFGASYSSIHQLVFLTCYAFTDGLCLWVGCYTYFLHLSLVLLLLVLRKIKVCSSVISLVINGETISQMLSTGTAMVFHFTSCFTVSSEVLLLL